MLVDLPVIYQGLKFDYDSYEAGFSSEAICAEATP